MKSKIFNIFLICISLNIYSKERIPKPINRFSFSAGIGMSYSIWNKTLDFEGASDVFIGSSTIQQKRPIGINLFGEFSFFFRRNFYLSAGLDYNHFKREFGYNTRFVSPDYPSEISFDYYGSLTDKNIGIIFTLNKKIPIKKHSIHLGTGILFMIKREPYIEIGFQPPPYQTNFTVSNKAVAEFGFPFQLCYEYAINEKWNIGLKTQFQYILSTQNSQNIYFSPYFRLNIQKMEKKRIKSENKTGN